MSSSSISEMLLIAQVQGKGVIRGKVFKHLAPVTLAKIQRELPFSGRVNFFEHNFAYILTPVVAGEEKSKQQFMRGSIAFMPSGSTLCLFLKDTRSYKPMNLLGQIDEGLEIIDKMTRGDTLRIESISAISTA